jgi:hypothetical protein
MTSEQTPTDEATPDPGSRIPKSLFVLPALAIAVMVAALVIALLPVAG